MKWLITVSRYLPEKVGGNFIYVNQFSEKLVEMGDTVHMVTTTLRKDLPSKEVIAGVTIHRILVERGNMGPIWFNYTKRVTDFVKQLDEQEQFDCINPHSSFMINTSKLRSKPYILYTLHAVVTYEYLFHLKKLIKSGIINKKTLKALIAMPVMLPLSFIREWLNVKRANQVIVMSHYVKGTIKSFLPGINLNNVFISRIGIDNTFAPSTNKNRLKTVMNVNNKTSLLTVRRLESRMGIGNLINALSLLNKADKLEGVTLHIAGKGSLQATFEKQIQQLGLSKHIKLLGFVSDQALRQWYQISDAFVMPTEELEGFGIVTIEAFASGIPVIATPAGANPEIAGRYCPELIAKTQTQPSDLADSIEIFLKNKAYYQSIDFSQQAKVYFDWQKIITEIKFIFQKNQAQQR